MTAYANEIVFFVLGLAGNFVVAAVYDRYKASRLVRAEAFRREEEKWSRRLGSVDSAVRGAAVEEVALRSLRWFILGNVMFGVSGITWILEFADLYPASNFLASITSLVAVILFGQSLSWLKLYFKHRRTEEPLAVA